MERMIKSERSRSISIQIQNLARSFSSPDGELNFEVGTPDKDHGISGNHGQRRNVGVTGLHFGGNKRDSGIQRGKSDSFILKDRTSHGTRGNLQQLSDARIRNGIGNKRYHMPSEEEYDYNHYDEASISRTSSASYHGLSFSIAGPVQLPESHFRFLTDVVEAKRYAATSLRKVNSKRQDQLAIRRSNSASERQAPLPISVQFVDVKYKLLLKRQPWRVRGRFLEKEILHGVSGHVVPGEVLALLGPSGSGKTTLLNVLSGRVQRNVEGTITYNDMLFKKGLKQRMGFVMQDDILYSHLTVKETLTYAALLRLPKKLTRRQKLERVQEVILDLGLERCQDTVIGGPFLRGVSGGERKRVSVGHEILIDPSLLFLDEPTSGLDSTTALRIIQLLHEIAKGGRTVVTTIHQPSSRLFHMFDKLILLTEGHMIYFGKAADCMDYFSCIGLSPLITMNPADFLLDLANGNISDISLPTALEQRALESEESKIGSTLQPSAKEIQQYLIDCYEAILEPTEKSSLLELGIARSELKLGAFRTHEWTVPWWQQFCVLFIRGFRERRNEYLSCLRIVQVIATSLIIGCLWWQSKLQTEKDIHDQVGLVFFIAIFWGFFPLLTAIFTFPQERAILARERASDMYQLSAYFMARILSDLPLDLGLPIIFLLIVYFMTHLRLSTAAFVLTLFSIFLNIITAQGLGIAIGAVMMDVKKATTLASVILLTFMLSGGFFVQHIPEFFSWIKYLSFNYYSFRLLIKVQYNPNQKYDCTSAGCKSLASSAVFHNISLEGGVEEIWAMLIMVVGYRMLAYIALRNMRLRV